MRPRKFHLSLHKLRRQPRSAHILQILQASTQIQRKRIPLHPLRHNLKELVILVQFGAYFVDEFEIHDRGSCGGRKDGLELVGDVVGAAYTAGAPYFEARS